MLLLAKAAGSARLRPVACSLGIADHSDPRRVGRKTGAEEWESLSDVFLPPCSCQRLLSYASGLARRSSHERLPIASDGQERNELLHRALELVRGEFEDRTWRAFWAGVVQQQSSVEIAARLQTTPGAVRQAKYKVLRRLRSELGDLLD